MTATTATVRPTRRNETPLHADVPAWRGAAMALGRAEARQLLRSPAVWVGAVLTGLLLWGVSGPTGDVFDARLALMGGALIPLAYTSLIAANLAALRARRDGTEELVGTTPTPAAARTVGHVLAGVVPLAVAAVLVGAAALRAATAGQRLQAEAYLSGIEVPTAGPPELLQGPVFVLLTIAVGVLLARWLPHPAVVIPLLLVFAFQAMSVVWVFGSGPDRWLWPLATDVITTGWIGCEESSPICELGGVAGFDHVRMWWHLAGLLAMTATVGALAVLRHHRTRRTLVTLGGLVTLTSALLAIQILTATTS